MNQVKTSTWPLLIPSLLHYSPKHPPPSYISNNPLPTPPNFLLILLWACLHRESHFYPNSEITSCFWARMREIELRRRWSVFWQVGLHPWVSGRFCWWKVLRCWKVRLFIHVLIGRAKNWYWWCVDSEILFSSNETFELLRVLEEVYANAAFAEEEYLGQLVQCLQRTLNTPAAEEEGHIIKKNEKKVTVKDAKRRMEEVRLAISRNLARAMVAGFDSPF